MVLAGDVSRFCWRGLCPAEGWVKDARKEVWCHEEAVGLDCCFKCRQTLRMWRELQWT